jgi:hypothetical protein
VGDPQHQQHDFEPGIAPSGLFWTIPITSAAIDVAPGIGEARLRGESMAVPDYHDIINAIFGGGPSPAPAHVSFDVRWLGHGERRKVRDEAFGFIGEYVTGDAQITFTAQVDGGPVYRSDPGGQFNPSPDQGGAGSPAVGHERNGIFFH